MVSSSVEGAVSREAGCYLQKYNMTEIDWLKYGTLMESCGWWDHGVMELLLGPRQAQHKLWVRAFKTPFQAYTLFKQLQQTMGIVLAQKKC